MDLSNYLSGKDVNNSVSARQVYPTDPSPSSGQRASAMTPFATGGSVQDDSGTGSAPVATGGVFGQPLAWWGVILVVLIALYFIAKKAGQGGEFSSIKLSVYNILTISLAAAVGFGFLKVVFARFQVPGLSTYIAAL